MGQDGGRNATLVRTLKLVLKMAAGPCTNYELMRDYGCSRRTFFRDLAAIEEAGFAVVKQTPWDERTIVRSVELPRKLRGQGEA